MKCFVTLMFKLIKQQGRIKYNRVLFSELMITYSRLKLSSRACKFASLSGVVAAPPPPPPLAPPPLPPEGPPPPPTAVA